VANAPTTASLGPKTRRFDVGTATEVCRGEIDRKSSSSSEKPPLAGV
jgi:hypothetical protein